MSGNRVLLGFIAAVLGFGPGTASVARDIRVQPRFMLGDFIRVARPPAHEFAPHAPPRALPDATAGMRAEASHRRAVDDAAAYLDKYPETLVMLMVADGRIVFQAYRGDAAPDRPLYSMSIAKSLTGLAVGQALCAGLIPSLDARVADQVPELGINNFGRSTLRDLLTMRSGAYVSTFIGQPKFRGGLGRRPRTGKPYRGYGWPVRLGQVTVADVLWGSAWRRVENADADPPGRVFGYKGADTLAAATVVARAAGVSLAAYFDRTVWQSVRGAGPGAWEADRDGATVASSGAQFRLTDWGRIAQWVLTARAGGDCFGTYLRSATSTRVSTQRPGRRAHPHFAGYGYQWWTENRHAPGFWAVGYAGQYIAIDPASRRILIKFGYAQYGRSARDLFELFAAWTRPAQEKP